MKLIVQALLRDDLYWAIPMALQTAERQATEWSDSPGSERNSTHAVPMRNPESASNMPGIGCQTQINIRIQDFKMK